MAGKRPQGIGKQPREIKQEDKAPDQEAPNEQAPPEEKVWYFKTTTKRRDDGKLVQRFLKMRLGFRAGRRVDPNRDLGIAGDVIPGIDLEFGDREHGPPGSYVVRESQWGQPNLPEGDPRRNLPSAEEVANFILSHPYYTKMGYITQVGMENQRLLEEKKRELAILTAQVTGDTSGLAQLAEAPGKPTIVRGPIHTPMPVSQYAAMPKPYPLEVSADAAPTHDIPPRE